MSLPLSSISVYSLTWESQITGATGFVGFAVLAKALQAGYKVRISVRKAAQIEIIKSHVLIAPYVEKGVVEFAVVPDITVKGAFDEALKDVVGVLHIASPLPAAVCIPDQNYFKLCTFKLIRIGTDESTDRRPGKRYHPPRHKRHNLHPKLRPLPPHHQTHRHNLFRRRHHGRSSPHGR